MVQKARAKRYRIKVSMNLGGHQLTISTRFAGDTRAGQGAKYLCSGEIDQRSGVEIAIACIFAPLNEVQEGATEDEVEQAIDDSMTAFEHYMSLARVRCKRRSRQRGASAKLQPTEVAPVKQIPEQSKEMTPRLVTNADDDEPVSIERGSLSSSPGADDNDGLDLENEVF